MRYIDPDAWSPSPGIDLEPNARTAVTAASNCLVIAGPGAGKTELLAQRAGYLLETNACPAPRRILAISFKRDAADNLRARIESRSGSELASRFDSHTFDSFAKGLIERFREGLPPQLRPPEGFEITTDLKTFRETAVRSSLRSRGSHLDPRWMLEKRMCSVPLGTLAGTNLLPDFLAAKALWLDLLKRQPCVLTFDLIKRLAELLIARNRLIARALRVTYSHVFLDEFQDTTFIQYDLLRAAFPRGEAIMTAVGDNKQRIMLWAGAMRDAFDRFVTDYDATRTDLLLNRRSDRKLVEIQSHLIAAIDPNCPLPSPAGDRMDGDGICEILEFAHEEDESDTLLSMVHGLLTNGVKPEEICVLVRQTALNYIHGLLGTFNRAGVALRLEEPYQLLLKDELIQSIIGLLSLGAGVRNSDHWLPVLDLVFTLDGVDGTDDKAADRAEARLSAFIRRMRPMMKAPMRTESQVEALVENVLSFLGSSRVRAHFPKVRNQSSLKKTVSDFVHLLFESWEGKTNWRQAIEAFQGRDTIPAMTIHKSKSLEHHTVFFVGLEDAAWWSFAKQSDEETCAFFVAFSRAKKQVYFTFCDQRAVGKGQARSIQQRKGVNSLYQLLVNAGVSTYRKQLPSAHT